MECVLKCFICKTCGVEYSESSSPPISCPICEDPRQYVGWQGQQWTSMDELIDLGYVNDLRNLEPNLLGIGITPRFSIGQRALLVTTDQGNILYDCVSVIDDNAAKKIADLGGISYICLSHPHFYDSMVSWSQEFDHAPIIIPEVDRTHVMRSDKAIEYWDGIPLEILPGITLIQTGGHFEGSSVLHWKNGAQGKGALLVGDTISVVQDRNYVSFMRSYPNLIPLSANQVLNIIETLKPYPYDRIYGGWWDSNVLTDGKNAVKISGERYINHIS